jgi:hypothetical protein
MLVFKAVKDRLPLLLRGNALGVHKLKPYLRSSEHLRALKKEISEGALSVSHAVARLRNYATSQKVAGSIPDETFQ